MKLLHIKMVNGRWGVYHSRSQDERPIVSATKDNLDIIFDYAKSLAITHRWFKSKQ